MKSGQGSIGGTGNAAGTEERRSEPDATDAAGRRRSVLPEQASDRASIEVVHEFNNLLTVVLGSLEQLERQQLDPAGRQQLRRAQWAAGQAGALTRRMMAAAGGDMPNGITVLDGSKAWP